ncbi:unnamed protein product [Phaedon cochleariae]|uniref:Amino acid transporter transmembrane domain-containing protein n=1 Tax=Phaedon cochleariae TaxID=80249 RepID=A0A9N9X3P2_PHACE|nr:unnamed protein product [Phaedon cochleariae]
MNPNQKEQDDEDYDPHLHRELEDPSTNFETFLNLLKGVLGTGILAMPEGFKYAGMINGIVCTMLIGIFSTYCFHVLVRSQYVLCKKNKIGLLPYPHSMKAALAIGPKWMRRFSKYAGGITNFFLIAYQIGTLCVYVIFVGVNIKTVFDQYIERKILLTFYILMSLPLCLMLMCVKNFKMFAKVSLFGNVVALLTIGVIGYYVFQDLPSFGNRPAFGNWADFPLYFGTSLFAIQSVPVVVSVENNMATPANFLERFGSLNIGFGIVTVLYTIVAMMGYWKYGEDIKSSITLNFPAEEAVGQSIRVLYSISIVSSYGLNGIVPIRIIWDDYVANLQYFNEANNCKKLMWEYALRIVMVLFTFLMALTIPHLGLFISLVGGFCLSMLGIAFPALMEICVLWPDRLGKHKWMLWKDLCIVAIGFVGFGASCYASIRDIYTELSAGNTIGST